MIRKIVKLAQPPATDYAEKFRQSQTNMGVAGSQGARVAAPCMTKHIIGATGKPEARILPKF